MLSGTDVMQDSEDIEGVERLELQSEDREEARATSRAAHVEALELFFFAHPTTSFSPALPCEQSPPRHGL